MKLEAEFKWYLAHQDELVTKYNGRYVVIKGEAVLGAYDTDIEAISETIKMGHAPGTFIVQRCEPGSASYTQTFHSRVSFR